MAPDWPRCVHPVQARQPRPWQLADTPADAMDQMLRAIVGIEITIDRIEGRCKASQDEDLPDRLGTVQGLSLIHI